MPSQAINLTQFLSQYFESPIFLNKYIFGSVNGWKRAMVDSSEKPPSPPGWVGSHSPLSPDSTSKIASSPPEGGAPRLYGYVCFYCHASLRNLACPDIKIVRAKQPQETKTNSRSYSSKCSTSSDPSLLPSSTHIQVATLPCKCCHPVLLILQENSSSIRFRAVGGELVLRGDRGY